MTAADMLAACYTRIRQAGPDAELLIRIPAEAGAKERIHLTAAGTHAGKGSPKGRIVTPDGEGSTIAAFKAHELVAYVLEHQEE